MLSRFIISSLIFHSLSLVSCGSSSYTNHKQSTITKSSTLDTKQIILQESSALISQKPLQNKLILPDLIGDTGDLITP